MKLVDIAIERLADGLYGFHVTLPDGQRRFYVCDELTNFPVALLREIATIHVVGAKL